MTGHLDCRPRERDEPGLAVPTPLSPRETEVVGLVVQGLTNAQAAARLGLSIRTVQSHVANALVKTGTRSRVQLAVFALCRGLVSCPCGGPSAPSSDHPDPRASRTFGTSAD
jgi:DNA-binding NarL/FixJ family response regulator